MKTYVKKVITLDADDRSILKNAISVLENLVSELCEDEYDIDETITNLEDIVYKDEFTTEYDH